MLFGQCEDKHGNHHQSSKYRLNRATDGAHMGPESVISWSRADPCVAEPRVSQSVCHIQQQSLQQRADTLINPLTLVNPTTLTHTVCIIHEESTSSSLCRSPDSPLNTVYLQLCECVCVLSVFTLKPERVCLCLTRFNRHTR